MIVTLGVVLAGGSGERLGGGLVKPLREVGGMTLLERALLVLREVCIDDVVVAPEGMELPQFGSRRVNDPPGAAGPLAGMVAGMEARAFSQAIVLAVDFPLMRASTLRALLARLEMGNPFEADAGGRPGETLAVVPAPSGIPQPLAAAYAPSAVEPLAAALRAGERSPVKAVRALGATMLDNTAIAELDGGAGNFHNVNTPDDLAEAERMLAARAGSHA